MAGTFIDPLRNNVPIVDGRGQPTPQFIRQWQNLLRALEGAEKRIKDLEGESPAP